MFGLTCPGTTGGVKVRDILWLLRRDGWEIVRQRGSHRQLKHPIKPGLVTVAGAPHRDLHPRTVSSILEQAGYPTRD